METHTKGWEIYPSLKPTNGEPVIRKRESDSFFGTTLQRELEKKGITHLIIAGGMTEYCVDTTCRRAASVGYDRPPATAAPDASMLANVANVVKPVAPYSASEMMDLNMRSIPRSVSE